MNLLVCQTFYWWRVIRGQQRRRRGQISPLFLGEQSTSGSIGAPSGFEANQQPNLHGLFERQFNESRSVRHLDHF